MSAQVAIKKTRFRIADLLMAAMLSTSTAQASDLSGQVQQAAIAAVHAAIPQQDVDIEPAAIDQRLNLTACAYPLAAKVMGTGQIKATATVEVSCSAPRPWRIYVPMRITAYANVLTAAHPLVKGDVLTLADVQPARRVISALAYGYFERPEQVVGRTVKRPLQTGTVISPADVQQTYLVRRGQEVNLLATQGALQVKSLGEAMGDGGLGDRIKVRNKASGRVVEGTIRSSEVVEVNF
jgi:flagella basal body P-ring formation protein FlgA